ncbi:acyltransferase family-domain-containing protein [Chaetomium tenue]|uniref:Acyltransferase family-domain-containing protein n=1 Tax=Chaetomium tenue TaxID=1854479 RepID=A0ACB7PNI0_9PEZI|nr:acyltransferase family-domain-containing protein [Chaetomium globosum]
MNGHAASTWGLAHEEEKATFLNDKPPPDIERDARHADVTSRFSTITYAPQQWTATTLPSRAAHRVLTQLPALLRRTLFFLLPSFVQPLFSRQRHHHHKNNPPLPPRPTAPQPGPTAYLDGMRGLAALIVFFCHFLYTSFAIAPGYGSGSGTTAATTTPTANNNHSNPPNPPNHHHHLPLLPFIRLLFSGPPMVCVFFIISGYALSLRPLTRAATTTTTQSTGTTSALTALTSLIFRRFPRLFLPAFASTLLITLLVASGMYERTRAVAANPALLRNVREPHVGFDVNDNGGGGGGGSVLVLAVWAWAGEMARFVHVWDWREFGGSTVLDVHLWTVPVEFRCSMVLFLTLAGTLGLRRGWRLGVVGGLAVFVYCSKRWEMVLFYAGLVLAELDVARGAHGRAPVLPVPVPGLMSGSNSRASSPSPSGPKRRTVKRAMWAVLSIVGLFLMSQPDERSAETPGWVFLTSLIPEWWTDEHRYWQSTGAILFVLAVGRSRGWQRFFNLPVPQYFGKISYAIYLMHGPVIHTVGYAIEGWAWGLTGTEGRAYEAGFALAAVFVVPIVIWVSDVFWRAVDAPIVRFAKWLEAVCSKSD